MKFVSVAKARNELSKILNSTRKEDIVITSWGKPKAALVNIEKMDFEDFLIARSERIQRSIEDSWKAYKRGEVFTFEDIMKKERA